jgi:hypothetical protein
MRAARPVTTAHRWRPRLRSAVAVFVLLPVVTLLGACSPPPRYPVAVFLDDGHPTALLYACPGESVTELSVADVTTPSAPSPGVTVPTGSTAAANVTLYVPYWGVHAVAEDRPTEIRLLTVPKGWALSEIVIPLREFQPGIRYWLDTGGIQDKQVAFTLEDLQTLEPGQVWARSANSDDERAMDRDEFFTTAKKYCD